MHGRWRSTRLKIGNRLASIGGHSVFAAGARNVGRLEPQPDGSLRGQRGLISSQPGARDARSRAAKRNKRRGSSGGNWRVRQDNGRRRRLASASKRVRQAIGRGEGMVLPTTADALATSARCGLLDTAALFRQALGVDDLKGVEIGSRAEMATVIRCVNRHIKGLTLRQLSAASSLAGSLLTSKERGRVTRKTARQGGRRSEWQRRAQGSRRSKQLGTRQRVA